MNDKARGQLPSGIWQDLARKVSALFENKSGAQPETAEETRCCRNLVHIAYRGVSDDRLYVAYGRKWADLRYFKPKGLKVFCADCRRRLY